MQSKRAKCRSFQPPSLAQMSIAARSARRALYRDFYELVPLFSSFAVRRSARGAPDSIKRSITSTACRRLRMDAQAPDNSTVPPPLEARQHGHRQLPLACPGCGALTQSVHPQEAGHYSTNRAAVRKYLNRSQEQIKGEATAEDEIVQIALANIPQELRVQLGFDTGENSKGMTRAPSHDGIL